MSEQGRFILITGAASGIGRATAERFAEKGWNVGLTDLDESGLDAVSAELGSSCCHAALLDVSDRDAFRRVIEAFGNQSGGRLDLLFNNAGVSGGRLFSQTAFSDIDQILAVNLAGVINGIHFAYPLLKNTPGSLCFTTSSSSAIFGVAGLSIYSATKHAVKGLTEALSIEFHDDDIRVADVLPGQIDTPMMPDEMREEAPPKGMWRLMPASAVAEAVWDSYHDGSGRLHWYVPEDLEKLERLVAEDPAPVRDASIKFFSVGPLKKSLE